MVKNKGICLLIFFLIIFSGCANNLKKSDYGELRERIHLYWTHRVKGEQVKSYAFEYPVYKKRVPIERYILRHSNPLVKYNGFEVFEIENEEEDFVRVKMKVNMSFKVPGARPLIRDIFVTDQWVKLEDGWYHVPEKADFTQKSLKRR